MYPHEPLRVCTNCRVHHYENCPDCMGWGLYRSATSGNLVPVMAAQAHGDVPPPASLEPCPTCGSTFAGLPAATVESSLAKVMRVFRDTLKRLA